MHLITTLISWAVLLQSIEHIWLQRLLTVNDPWSNDPPSKSFFAVLVLRLLSAITGLIFPIALAFAVMWASTYWIAVRYRGTFNGGSDGMTFHILGAVLMAKVFPAASAVAVTYIAVLVSLSYFVAGLVKILAPEWRNGSALSVFLNISNATIPNSATRALTNSAWVARSLAYAGMLFDLTFPLALFIKELTPAYLVAGILFHLGNYWMFGLNRFFWAWLAAYPAVYLFAAQRF